MSRFNFQINASSIIILIIAIVFGVAFLQKSCDAKKAGAQAATLAGELTDAQKRLTVGDLQLQTARSTIATLQELQDENLETIRELERGLKIKDLEITRKSRAIFELTAELKDAKAIATATRRGDAVEYEWTGRWAKFSTPDVFGQGGELLKLYNIFPEVHVFGIRQVKGILRSEKITIQFRDGAGDEVPIRAELRDYALQHAVDLPPEPRWFEKCDLKASVYGGVYLPYPMAYEGAGANVGILAGVYGAYLAVEADLSLGDVPFQGIIRSGYSYDLF